jgi:hypothetical protein
LRSREKKKESVNWFWPSCLSWFALPNEICHCFMRAASTVFRCIPLWIPWRDPSCFGPPQPFLFRAFEAALWTWTFDKCTEDWPARRDNPISSPSAASRTGEATHSVARPTVFGTASFVSRCVMFASDCSAVSDPNRPPLPNQLLMSHTLT